MSTEGLIAFFMSRRKCSFAQAQRMADVVVVRRKLAKERQTDHLERAQLTLGLDEMPAEEATHSYETDEPLPF